VNGPDGDKYSPAPLFPVRVLCYAGYRGEETPRRFYLGTRLIEVAEVLDRWLAPGHRYFKLRATDGDLYILRHASHADSWELTVFESGGNPPG
jgi:hypothetical protein